MSFVSRRGFSPFIGFLIMFTAGILNVSSAAKQDQNGDSIPHNIPNSTSFGLIKNETDVLLVAPFYLLVLIGTTIIFGTLFNWITHFISHTHPVEQFYVAFIGSSPMVYSVMALVTICLNGVVPHVFVISLSIIDEFGAILLVIYVRLLKAIVSRIAPGTKLATCQTDHHFFGIDLSLFLPQPVFFTDAQLSFLSSALTQYVVVRIMCFIVAMRLEFLFENRIEAPMWPYILVYVCMVSSKTFAVYWMSLFNSALPKNIGSVHVTFGYRIVIALIGCASLQPLVFKVVAWMLRKMMVEIDRDYDLKIYYVLLVVEMFLIFIIMFNHYSANDYKHAAPPPPPVTSSSNGNS